MAAVEPNSTNDAVRLRAQVVCPHCWNSFSPEAALWIAQHPDLLGDARLGPDQQRRFLPTRFTVDGAALDMRDFPCHSLACPKCHLGVPRALFEVESLFVSVLGAPACGKSYFLAAMTWQLRRTLPRDFRLAFEDADPVSNQRLHEYEALQFLNASQDALVAIDKTETQGDLYNTVLFGEQPITYPKPFLFTVSPLSDHPNQAAMAALTRVLCLYDNAGESFLPGYDTAVNPVTRHLALSGCLLFLFDPTQDPRFRAACRGQTDDPQMAERTERLSRERAVRQETILLEAADRIRRYAGLAHKKKHTRPLIVIVTKYDSWKSLLPEPAVRSPWATSPRHPISAMDTELVEDVSRRLRALLWDLCPELVSAAENFAEHVLYVPVSATGRAPERDRATGAFGFRPRDMKPIWVEVPVLYSLSRWMSGLVPYLRPKTQAPPPAPPRENGDGAAGERVPLSPNPPAFREGPK